MAFVWSIISKVVFVHVVGFMVLMNCCFLDNGRSCAQVLPEEEVATLQAVTKKLKIDNWTITQSSCGSDQWHNFTVDVIQTNVTCDCTFNSSTVCHVTNIRLNGFNASGVLPDELGKLTYLTELDLSLNYIGGSIPTSLTHLPNLRVLSLLGNRFNGSIPDEIGNIATLEELNLEDNLFGGPLPSSLGHLGSLRRLLLSSNNFTGTIPETFGNLKNLTDFRIDGNSLSGKLPDFIGNWTNIHRLDLQGTSMEGPIPSGLSLLTNLLKLSISDLGGQSSGFPDLSGMKRIDRLILRNCSITGTIPAYIGNMTKLKTLDLSFNSLTGPIPSQLASLENIIDYMFLNGNSLTGEVPSWILDNRNNIDLSYNNFTGSAPTSCQQPQVNLVSSHSSSENNSLPWCLRKDLPCSEEPQYSSLFINCGGTKTTFGKNVYEEDLNINGPSSFIPGNEQWAYSSTGVFMGKAESPFTAGNRFKLNVTGGEIYTSARVAPSSLKYYGLCMLKGSYTVRLYFAEIMYSGDNTFSSLGKRIFDVSIQGNVVLKDFNIAKEAGGVGIGIYKEFNNVSVHGSTLEIHFYWKGKGTAAIPNRGVYGPLISAISVTPNFKVDATGGLSAGAIVGIVAASCVVVLFVLQFLTMGGFLRGKKEEDRDLRGLDLQTASFTLKQIKQATDNFSPANKIGEGGFGPVYKGTLADGAVIAVKQLSAKSRQGSREFVNEIGMISALQHPNLVRLYGCCIEGNQLLLVYEYLENNCLARALFGPEQHRIELDWSTRKRILLGIARGLAYLHEESRLKIVHRDIKATNVLLDKDLNAKISDFGLAKLDTEEDTHISTRIAGTIGYMAPEYAMRGYLTEKADVYSFGVVALEIVSGKSNTNYRPKEEFVYLLDWAYVLQEQGNLLELVDPSLGSSYSREEAMRMLNLALLCTNPSPTLRPSMTSVVSMLQGKIPLQAPIINRGSMNHEATFMALEILSHDSETSVSNFTNESQMLRTLHMDGSWTDSSLRNDETTDYSSSSKLLDKDVYDTA